MKLKWNKLHSMLIVVLLIAVQFVSVPLAGRASADTGSTAVSVSPAIENVTVGDTFTVDVAVAPGVAIAGAQFNLSYNPSLLSVTSVTEGNFLKQGSSTSYFQPGEIDNTAGSLTKVAGAITVPGGEVSGAGTFATVTFQAKAAGTSALTLSEVVASTKEGVAVPVLPAGGSVTVTGGGSGGGGGISTPAAVTSTTGSATIDPAAGGSVSLGSDAKITIPAGALAGTTGVDVAIQRVSSSPAAPSGFSLLGSVYEFTVGGKTGYAFTKPVTLTFPFDPTKLAAGETPSIYYYDETKGQWVSLGGTVSGNTISVAIDHFTKFAVLAKGVVPPPVPAQLFSDVPASYWASNVINDLSAKGYISGYPDGTFKPDNQITRAEFATVLVKALGLTPVTEAQVQFQDVPATSWYYTSVATAAQAGLIKGLGDGFFAPSTPITREQMAVMIVKALESTGYTTSDDMQALDKFGDRNSIDAWALPGMAKAINAGVVHGTTTATIAPLENATRAQAAAMVQTLLKLTGKL